MSPKLYYCDECNHIYFNLPEDRICAICHNELDEKNIVSDQAILTCETCHSLYPVSSANKLIVKENNQHFLCGCVNQCPTNSTLNISQGITYFGNIVLTDIYKCSNCGAIYYRNSEEKDKSCHECNARFVSPLKIDPDKQKTFFRCSNKEHGIRLKLRDLIEENNNIIKNLLKTIKSKDQQLQNEYLKKQKNIFDVKFKSKTKKQQELHELTKWALQERRKIYGNLHSQGFRCVVYKEKAPNELQKTNEGCGALASMRIRKIIDTDIKGTVIDRKAVQQSIQKQSQESSQKKHIEPTQKKSQVPIQTKLNTEQEIIEAQPNIEEENSTTNLQKELNTELQKTTIIRPLPDGLQDLTNEAQKNFEMVSEIEEKYGLFKLEIKLNPQLSDDNKFRLVNHAILPIERLDGNDEFYLDKETLLKAWWAKPDRFSKNPWLIGSLLKIIKEKPLLTFKKSENEIICIPNTEFESDIDLEIINEEENIIKISDLENEKRIKCSDKQFKIKFKFTISDVAELPPSILEWNIELPKCQTKT